MINTQHDILDTAAVLDQVLDGRDLVGEFLECDRLAVACQVLFFHEERGGPCLFGAEEALEDPELAFELPVDFGEPEALMEGIIAFADAFALIELIVDARQDLTSNFKALQVSRRHRKKTEDESANDRE